MIKGVKTPSKTTFVSLMVFYLVFVVSASIFFWLLITDIASGSESRFKEGVLAVIFLCFNAAIIGGAFFSIIFIVVKLLQLKKVSPLQGGLKLRLMGYFSWFAFLVSVPQVLLAIILIFTASNKWLPEETQEVIAKSRNSLMAIREERVRNLKSFSQGSLFASQIANMVKNPKAISFYWKELSDINPSVSGLQVFDQSGEELFFCGNENARSKFKKFFEKYSEGELPILVAPDHLLFRFLVPIEIPQASMVKVVVSFAQPVSENNLISDLALLSEHYKPLIQSRHWIKTNITFVLLVFILAINLVSIYLSLYISNLIIVPIWDIEQATRKVAEGDFSVRLYSEKKNHFAQLVNSFNKMVFDLEKLQINSTHFNKMKAWQDIARRMAHEINNPLTPICMSAERMLRQYQKDPENFEPVLKKGTRLIIDEVESLKSLLSDFRAFSRLPDPIFEESNLHDIIIASVELYRNCPNKTIVFNLDGVDPQLGFPLDRLQLKQVFSNLIKNSIESMSQTGQINISTVIVSRQNIRYCRVILEDTGCGMDQTTLDNIFTPYFTTKNEGTGLGLSIVERIVFSHKGKIRALSKKGEGTSFLIDLPLENKNE